MISVDTGLGDRCRKTLLADYMELHSVADYLAGDVLPDCPHQSLDHGVSKLSYRAALDATGMVVVFDACKAVLRPSVREYQFADHSRFEKELYSTVDRCPAYSRKLVADLLGAEAIGLVLEQRYYGPSRARHAVTVVFQDGQEVVPCGSYIIHDTLSQLQSCNNEK